MRDRFVETHHARVRVFEGGEGDPLLFLHGAGGMAAEDPFLDALSRRFRVYAPFLPGYGETAECGSLRDMLDFTLHAFDIVEALELADPIVAGHSMGGMIAAEMAAIAPHDVSRLALISPAGLWLDAAPIPDLFTLLPFELPAVLFHDADKGAAMLTAGLRLDDPEFLKTYLVRNARQLGMAGKILFPVPERGLSTRLYRVKAKTLILWGESDRLIPVSYADAWEAALPGSTVVKIPEAGHMSIWEKPELIASEIAALA